VKNLLLLLVAVLMMAFLPTALAAAAPTDICGGTGAASAYCKSKTSADPIAGPNGILIKATNLITIVAGIALVVMLIISGIRYITSAGDSAGIQKAKDTIMHALTGLVVIVLARTLIAFIVSRI